MYFTFKIWCWRLGCCFNDSQNIKKSVSLNNFCSVPTHSPFCLRILANISFYPLFLKLPPFLLIQLVVFFGEEKQGTIANTKVEEYSQYGPSLLFLLGETSHLLSITYNYWQNQEDLVVQKRKLSRFVM